MGLWGTKDHRHGAIALAVALLVVAGGVVSGSPAGALHPVPGVATVDGSSAEWTPADDVAALVGNDPPHLEQGRLSLRYDCEEQVIYALLLAGPGLRLQATDPAEAYLRLGSATKLVDGTDGADGEAPDAAWIDRSDGTARGVEMSAPLAPGSYEAFRVHAKLPDDSADGYETLDLSPRHQQLTVGCDAGLAVADLALADPSSDPPDPGDPSGLARTGAPLLPLLAAVGAFLFAAGVALRMRRWDRPAGR